MKGTNILITHPKGEEQTNALKAFLEALKIKFEEPEKNYNKDFVEKIKKSKKQFDTGKYITLKKDQISKFF